MKLLDKWSPFRLQKRVAELEQNVVNLQKALVEEIKLHDKLKNEVQQGQARANSVYEIKDKEKYWVVSQGGYFQIKGSLLRRGGNLLQIALHSGFVVSTADEAKVLYSKLKGLVK